MSASCNYCGVELTPRNHELKEHVDVADGDVAPICDDCWQELSHEAAKRWCLENCRPMPANCPPECNV
jgi:hypothetical protein